MANIIDTTLWGADGLKIPPSFRDKAKVGIFEDFEGAALNITDGKWASNTVETGGSPTVSLTADTANGEVGIAIDTTNEVQRAELYWNDQLNVDITKNPVFRCRLKNSATLAGNQFAVFGLASARNDDPDVIATSVWFKLAATADILVEGDDGTTDTDDSDSGTDLTAATYTEFEINCADLAAVEFYIDGVKQSTTIAMSAATGTLQPFIQVGKTSGATGVTLTVDWIELEWDRS